MKVFLLMLVAVPLLAFEAFAQDTPDLPPATVASARPKRTVEKVKEKVKAKKAAPCSCGAACACEGSGSSCGESGCPSPTAPRQARYEAPPVQAPVYNAPREDSSPRRFFRGRFRGGRSGGGCSSGG